ncbi:winged helix-turn-helix domain-containing protein, partial [Streptomyces sp. URMC 123]|uniref:winged helix-turn-helix domain-containing protein n=1 Tax=Streptomyces sp. URMC 123 TaxID=3423403 RepID=UPI003F1AE195
GRAHPGRPVAQGPLRIDPGRREVRLGDRRIDLTRKEFDLLYLLASHPETVIPRAQVMARVWEDGGTGGGRTVDTHVSSLRGKLGAKSWVVTVRGVGFRLGHG